MPKSQNVQLMESLYAAFGNGDIATVMDGFDPQIEWLPAENGPYGGTQRGKQAVLENIFSRLPADWDNFTVTPQEYLDAGDTVIALGRYAGTNRNTGRQILAQFAHLWEIRGRKVIRYRQYVDTLQMAEAFGTANRVTVSAAAH